MSSFCLLAVLGCDQPRNPVAPSGTVLSITASPSKINLSGQSSAVTVTGLLPDGNVIRPGTQISLTTTLGVLRPVGGTCASATVADIVEANDRGQGQAILCGDGRQGDATVSASLLGTSGSGDTATGSVNVKVQIGEGTTSKPTLVMNANPSVITVFNADSDSDESTITLIGRNVDGSAVAAGSRIRLTSNLGRLTCTNTFRCPGESIDPCSAVCTNSRGEAEVKFTANERAGTGKVTAILGTSDAVSVDIDINAAINSLDLTGDPLTIDRSDTGVEITLRAIVLDSQGSPLSSVLVRFESPHGSFDSTAVPTNSQGLAETTLTVRRADVTAVPADGTFLVTATATAEGVTRSDTVTITVRGAP